MSSVYPIFDDLTRPSQGVEEELPPALELNQLLLRAVAMEACGPTCNAQVKYRLASRAHKLMDQIVSLMDEVDLADTLENGQNAFNQWAEMVDPLEDELFKVAALPEREDYDYGMEISSEFTLIAPYLNWEADRRATQEAYLGLCNEPFLPDPALQSEYEAASKYDDISCLLSFKRHISMYREDEADEELLDVLHEVDDHYGAIVKALRQAKRYDENAGLLAIRTAFILSGLLIRTANDDAAELKETFWTTEEPWFKATDILASLQEAIGGENPKEVLRISALWEDFERYLMNGMPSNDILKRIAALMKLARFIRRPYNSQAIGLVQQCAALELASRSVQLPSQARDRRSLRKTVQAVEEFLRTAQHDELARSTSSWDQISQSDASVKFNHAKSMIQQGFARLGRPDFVTPILENARQKDRRSIARMYGVGWDGNDENGLPAKHPTISAKASAQREKINVTVLLIPANAPVRVRTMQLTLNAVETLDAVLWQIRAQSKVNILARNPRFVKDANHPDVEIESYTTLSSLKGTASGVVLTLILDDLSDIKGARRTRNDLPNPAAPESDASFNQPTLSRIRGRERPSRILQQRPNGITRRESSGSSGSYSTLQVPRQEAYTTGRISPPFDDGWGSSTPTAWEDSSSSTRSPVANRRLPHESSRLGNASAPAASGSDRPSTLGLVLGLLEESGLQDRDQLGDRTSASDEELQRLASLLMRRAQSGSRPRSVQDRSPEPARFPEALTA